MTAPSQFPDRPAKRRNFFLVLIVILSAFSIGAYFRLHPLIHQSSSDLKDKARLLVMAKIRSTVDRQVESQYPAFPQVKKEQLKNKYYADIIIKEKENFQKSVEELFQKMRQGKTAPRDGPYLLGSDSFNYFALTKNIVRTGKMAEVVQGSKYYNPLMLAPEGHYEPLNYHPYVGFTVYRALNVFRPDISLMYAVSWTPLLLTFLCLVVFVLTLRQAGTRFLPTFSASVFFLLSPAFVKRSAFGWYDNDPYNVLFPLLLTFLYWKCLDLVNKRKNPSFLAGALSVVLGCYALFWHGWHLFYGILLAAGLVIFLLNNFGLRQRNKNLPLAGFHGVFLIISFFCVSLFFGPREFFTVFGEGYRALVNFLSPQLSVWPDLFISVGELHRSSVSFLIRHLGGKLFFAGVLWGLVSSLFRCFKERSPLYVHQTAMLAVYFLITLILAKGAQRFILMLLVPSGLLLGMGFHNFLLLAESLLKRIPAIRSRTRLPLGLNALLGVLILIPAVFPVRHMKSAIASHLNPIYNSTWDRAMTKIREKTPKESIINSWWPPGHFIKAMAERRVTFDGATINFPQAYWMSNVFLATDETYALGILRMLNSNANQAAKFLEDLGIRTSKAVQLINDIVRYDKTQARIILNVLRFPEAYIGDLLELTHGRPLPTYILVYNELPEKNIQFKFIGHWNFEKVEELQTDKALREDLPRRNSAEYIQYLWNLAGGPYKDSGVIREMARDGNRVIFEKGVTLNTETMEVSVRSEKFGSGRTVSVFYADEDDVYEKVFPDADLAYSALLYEDTGRYRVILMDRDLAKSMLMQMFYFDAKGLDFIRPFFRDYDVTRRTEIAVFEVDWEAFRTSGQ